MPNLTVTVGTINFTDWLHVTVAKVSAPGNVLDEKYINVPVTNYVFNFNNLDPENYYVNFYDSPDDVSLGTIQMQLIVNALTQEWQYEKRFYRCGGSNPGDPAHLSDNVTDPYLIGKNVVSVFKEAFRFYEPIVEYSFDAALGKVTDLTGSKFNNLEVFSVDIKYAIGSVSATVGGFYSGVVNVPEATRTLLSSDRNALVRLVGSTSKQAVTLPMLSSLTIDDGFYFDNTCGGVAKCVKIFCDVSDDIRFNGFNTSIILFKEIWVRQGEHLLIRKHDADYWEIRLDYAGVRVGVKEILGFKDHSGIQPENGALIDGDEEGRLYWFVKNVLPSTHKYTDATIASAGGVHTANKRGQFCLHPTLPRFRMPDTRGLVAKGLTNFDTYGADAANRPVDAPGGIQLGQVGDHDHFMLGGSSVTNNSPVTGLNYVQVQNETGGAGDFKYTLAGNATVASIGRTSKPTANIGAPVGAVTAQNRVDNNGVIWGVHL